MDIFAHSRDIKGYLPAYNHVENRLGLRGIERWDGTAYIGEDTEPSRNPEGWRIYLMQAWG
jgi:hypothetical protein